MREPSRVESDNLRSYYKLVEDSVLTLKIGRVGLLRCLLVRSCISHLVGNLGDVFGIEWLDVLGRPYGDY